MHTPCDDMLLSNIHVTGILQSVRPFLSGAPPPKKNPGSTPAPYNSFAELPVQIKNL